MRDRVRLSLEVLGQERADNMEAGGLDGEIVAVEIPAEVEELSEGKVVHLGDCDFVVGIHIFFEGWAVFIQGRHHEFLIPVLLEGGFELELQ